MLLENEDAVKTLEESYLYLKLDDDKFNELCARFIKTEIPKEINKDKMLSLLKTRISKFSELDEKMSFFITLPDYDKELFLNKKNKIADFDIVKDTLEAALNLLEGVESFDNDTLFSALAPLCEKLGMKTGAIMWCIRIAVSGMSATPGGATEIMEVIGKNESLSRIKVAIEKL